METSIREQSTEYKRVDQDNIIITLAKSMKACLKKA